MENLRISFLLDSIALSQWSPLLSVLLENINSLERAQEFAARINDKTAGARVAHWWPIGGPLVQWPDVGFAVDSVDSPSIILTDSTLQL